jgi:hypothetical protein
MIWLQHGESLQLFYLPCEISRSASNQNRRLSPFGFPAAAHFWWARSRIASSDTDLPVWVSPPGPDVTADFNLIVGLADTGFAKVAALFHMASIPSLFMNTNWIETDVAGILWHDS